MTLWIAEFLCWSAGLGVMVHQHNGDFAWLFVFWMALCLIKAPGIAREEDEQAARDAEYDAYWGRS